MPYQGMVLILRTSVKELSRLAGLFFLRQSPLQMLKSMEEKITKNEMNPNNEQWFAARVHFGQEIKIKKTLESLGIESFIPTEDRRDYRGQIRQHPLIPALVFIRSPKKQAMDLKALYHLPVNYIFDATAHKVLTVPDKQMEDFQRVFDLSKEHGGLTGTTVERGQKVIVVKGPLRGVEGTVVSLKGKYYVSVSLLGFFSASAEIPISYLQMAE